MLTHSAPPRCKTFPSTYCCCNTQTEVTQQLEKDLESNKMRPSFGMLRRSGGYAAGLISAVYIATQPAISAAVDFDGSVYARNVSLHTNLDIFWTIDIATETIRVAVHAKAASGWAGVGISEMGGMEGADILYYETAVNNLLAVDSYSLHTQRPV